MLQRKKAAATTMPATGSVSLPATVVPQINPLKIADHSNLRSGISKWTAEAGARNGEYVVDEIPLL
jgi:hypothetical protein